MTITETRVAIPIKEDQKESSLGVFLQEVDGRLDEVEQWPIVATDYPKVNIFLGLPLDSQDVKDVYDATVDNRKALSLSKFMDPQRKGNFRLGMNKDEARAFAALYWGFKRDLTYDELKSELDAPTANLIRDVRSRNKTKSLKINQFGFGINKDFPNGEISGKPNMSEDLASIIPGITQGEFLKLNDFTKERVSQLHRDIPDAAETVSSTRISPTEMKAIMRAQAFIVSEAFRYGPEQEYHYFEVKNALRSCMALFTENPEVGNMQEVLIGLSKWSRQQNLGK